MLSYYARRRLLLALGGIAAAAVIGAGLYFGITALTGDDGPAAAPEAVGGEVESAEDLGFPAFATKNTTRVAGADPAADAAGVALASFPSGGGVEGPAAVALVESGNWPAGIVASTLTADPIGAPVLISGSDEVGDLTLDAIEALEPKGSGDTGDAQVLRIGDAAVPEGLRAEDVSGANPAELAVAVSKLRQRLTDEEPEHVLLVSSDEPAYAMPAAAWAARSGDPVLFVQRESVPEPTQEALRENENLPTYLLGPESVVSGAALKEIEKVAPTVQRIAGDDPVANAIEFARYAEGTFGWNINDPGHGFVIANSSRPLDAAAASALSATGKWGPLLLTDTPTAVPPALRGYLLDVKPGYQDDPTRAFYNHIWLIGDQAAISTSFQVQVDELAELARIRAGTGEPRIGPPPGKPEGDPRPGPGQ